MSSYPLKNMFDAIPRRYDLINRIFTWGLDRRWRKRAARFCLEKSPETLLDLCTGTGDLAILLSLMGREAALYALDYSPPMLSYAAAKTAKAGAGKISFILANAAELPFPDGTFGAVGIAFAFRNLTFRNPLREKALREIARVIAPGGRFVIVESSRPANPLLLALFRLYVSFAVGFVGGLIAGDRGAYRYLAFSAKNYYPPEEVSELLKEAGFSSVHYERCLFGAAAIHVAEK